MKYILGLGLFLVGGALVTSACTQSDSHANQNPSRDTTGTTTTGSGSGGESTTTGTGGYDTGGSGGTGGYDTGGTGGTAGEGGWNNAGGEGGDGGTGGSGGTGGDFCDGDDNIPDDDLPSCYDLPYAAVTCTGETPIGVTLCEQYSENATDEAFASMFECLNELEVDCGDLGAHGSDVTDCTGLVFDACETDLAAEKCEAFGCQGDGDDQIPESLCVAMLSSLTDDGVQAVIDCSNQATQTPPGSPWGGSSDVKACDRAFLDCFSGDSD